MLPLPSDLPDHPDAARLRASALRHDAPGGEPGAVWREWGAGAPVVLLHGGSGSWTHWIANIEPLVASGRRVLAADLPGFGESRDLPWPHSADKMARILRRGLAALVPEGPVQIVAFSFSALIAAHLAAMEGPARITRLVLVGPARFGAGISVRDRLRSWRRARSPEDELDAHRVNLEVLMLRDGAAIDPPMVRLQAENARAMRIRINDLEDLGPTEDPLADARIPLAGIWGEHDAIAGPLEASRDSLARLDPGAPFHVVPDVGHWVMYEGAEAVNALLDGLLHR